MSTWLLIVYLFTADGSMSVQVTDMPTEKRCKEIVAAYLESGIMAECEASA